MAAYYEKGFESRTEVKGIEYQGEAPPGLLEGHNSSPKAKKYDYESEGVGGGPAAK